MSRDVLPRVLLLCLASVLGALIPTPALAQQRLLRLEVWRLDKEGRKQPAQGASVSLLGHGNPTRVQNQGQAQVFLPSVLEPGDPLTPLTVLGDSPQLSAIALPVSPISRCSLRISRSFLMDILGAATSSSSLRARQPASM